MTYTPSECAKMGSQRSREVSAEIKRRNIEKYFATPKLCKKCKSIIPYEKRRNNFCTMSCAASVRNLGKRRHGDPIASKIKRDIYIKTEKYKSMRVLVQNARNKSRREALLSCFGKSCSLCNFEKRITIHEKRGKAHKDFRDMSWEEINDIINNKKNEYTSLCYRCHKHVHWCMEMLGMSWDDICKRL